MLGLSYGEVIFLIGATAALIGPKDLPVISRAAGRLVGKAIGYVQSARGQIESVLQQSQVTQVHKELQDTMAQLDAIRYEIRSISIMNPGPLTKRLIDEEKIVPTAGTPDSGTTSIQKINEAASGILGVLETGNGSRMNPTHVQSQATAYAHLAESMSQIPRENGEQLNAEGLLVVLPVSAESTGFLPKRKGGTTGSDVLLEAILEAEVAHNANQFFSQAPALLKDQNREDS